MAEAGVHVLETINYIMFIEEGTMAKDKDRFIMSHKEGSQLSIEGVRMIFVDRVTGVNYFALCNGGGGTALTPLLDSEGRVVVTNPALLTG